MVNNSTNINKTNNHLYLKPLNNRDTTFTSGNSGPDFGQAQNKLMGYQPPLDNWISNGNINYKQ
jgi:hypothetical protein